jgi:hypothetical protein
VTVGLHILITIIFNIINSLLQSNFKYDEKFYPHLLSQKDLIFFFKKKKLKSMFLDRIENLRAFRFSFVCAKIN